MGALRSRRLRRIQIWSLWATLTDPTGQLLAETSVSLGPIDQPLPDFFYELRGTGWDGEKQWVGMEGGIDVVVHA